MHPIKEIVSGRSSVKQRGIVSYCTANEIVIEAAAEDASSRGRPLLIEATANQVNQFGGYTGMLPADFAAIVRRISTDAGLPLAHCILGGDHLGPLLWQDEPESAAMDKAETLVREFVKAGFTKIHLDTSMRLGDDDPQSPLAVEVVARRGARLAKAVMEECGKSGCELPVFIIGSEVPVPGGTQRDEEEISVTSVADFDNTVDTYKHVFAAAGLEAAWDNVVGVVVQPGVEFSDNNVFQYRPDMASSLMASLRKYPGLAFEGHSTDYQTGGSLRAMVRDGVAIMKVGPELTFILREGLFALDAMEAELQPEHNQAHFRDVLEDVMLSEPGFWEKYYHGSHKEKQLARRYSFSDRSRYYLANPVVRAAVEKLFTNYDTARPHLNVVHQYLPAAVDALMGNGYPSARQLLKQHVIEGTLNKFQNAVS